MEISKISSKGQITIPVSVRNKLNLKTGDNVVIFEENGRFYIENAAAISLKYIGHGDDSVKYDFAREDSQLKVAEPEIRYCTVRESLQDSLREVKEIREGKRPAMTLDDLFSDIDKWRSEEELDKRG